jgi:hypothetical protein
MAYLTCNLFFPLSLTAAPTAAPTPSPTPEGTTARVARPARRERVGFTLKFESADAAVLDNEEERASFEGEFLAVMFREARLAFTATVDFIEPEDESRSPSLCVFLLLIRLKGAHLLLRYGVY